MAGVAGRADLFADEVRLNRRTGRLRRRGHGGFRRRIRWRGVAVQELLQRIDRVVRLGEAQRRGLPDRPVRADAVGEFREFCVDRFLTGSGLRGRFGGWL